MVRGKFLPILTLVKTKWQATIVLATWDIRSEKAACERPIGPILFAGVKRHR